ncbi:MAG: hypothetical protein ABDI07_11450 [Candidatus Kryptonium sp.]
MSDYLQSLENQGFKSDIPKMAHYVRLSDYSLPTNDNVPSNMPSNVPMCHNMTSTGCHIKNIDTQGPEANVPFCHPDTFATVLNVRMSDYILQPDNIQKFSV